MIKKFLVINILSSLRAQPGATHEIKCDREAIVFDFGFQMNKQFFFNSLTQSQYCTLVGSRLLRLRERLILGCALRSTVFRFYWSTNMPHLPKASLSRSFKRRRMSLLSLFLKKLTFCTGSRTFWGIKSSLPEHSIVRKTNASQGSRRFSQVIRSQN